MKVVVTSKGKSGPRIYHRLRDGDPLCGSGKEGKRRKVVDPDVIEPVYRPCELCFPEKFKSAEREVSKR